MAAGQRGVSEGYLSTAPGREQSQPAGAAEAIGAATVDRYFRRGLQRQFREWHPPRCPPVPGIDEHFFSRRAGYATTLCDLRHRKVYDVVLGRTEPALQAYLARLEGKAEVRVVCMDLTSVYRSLVRKHWPAGRNWIRSPARTAACSR